VNLYCSGCGGLQDACAVGAWIVPTGVTSVTITPMFTYWDTWAAGDSIKFVHQVQTNNLAGVEQDDMEFANHTYTSKPYTDTHAIYYATEMAISGMVVTEGYFMRLYFFVDDGELPSGKVRFLGWRAQLS